MDPRARERRHHPLHERPRRRRVHAQDRVEARRAVLPPRRGRAGRVREEGVELIEPAWGAEERERAVGPDLEVERKRGRVPHRARRAQRGGGHERRRRRVARARAAARCPRHPERHHEQRDPRLEAAAHARHAASRRNVLPTHGAAPRERDGPRGPRPRVSHARRACATAPRLPSRRSAPLPPSRRSRSGSAILGPAPNGGTSTGEPSLSRDARPARPRVPPAFTTTSSSVPPFWDRHQMAEPTWGDRQREDLAVRHTMFAAECVTLTVTWPPSADPGPCGSHEPAASPSSRCVRHAAVTIDRSHVRHASRPAANTADVAVYARDVGLGRVRCCATATPSAGPRPLARSDAPSPRRQATRSSHTAASNPSGDAPRS